jgi:hypothetical protein
VENFYLSSLTPIEGKLVDDEVAKVAEVDPLKTAEEIKSERVISGNIPKQNSTPQL